VDRVTVLVDLSDLPAVMSAIDTGCAL